MSSRNSLRTQRPLPQCTDQPSLHCQAHRTHPRRSKHTHAATEREREQRQRDTLFSLSLLTGRKHSPPEAHHQHKRRHPRTQHTPYHTKRASKPARVSHRSTAKHIVRIHADPNTHTQTHRHTHRENRDRDRETRSPLSVSLDRPQALTN